MTARVKSERECKEAEERLKEMQESMERHQTELQEARDTIARLEQQLRETQVLYHNSSRIFIPCFTVSKVYHIS